MATFFPAGNYKGLYCVSGRYIALNYTLSHIAYHRSRVRGYSTGSEMVREISASSLSDGFRTTTDYYYGMVTNLSSDAVTIKNFSICF